MAHSEERATAAVRAVLKRRMEEETSTRNPRVGVTDLWYHSHRRDEAGRKAKTKLHGRGRRWQSDG